ncbi:DEAD-box ATP-dependent RNA helicase 40-like [Helianthus annuus]|uniref:DEAD-box ATP-dependent RNA helicase 40-like n=1 Tax=Helianthus annuus TaxID=4232 RepID=UPI001652D5E3|nr:DEAD-box ATP-dependent RNA helicase 40-like [Helianthus annuus]
MAFPDAMTLSSVDIYRKKYDIIATGDNVPALFMSFESTRLPAKLLSEGDNVPALFMTFESIRLPAELLSEIYAAGFASPTPIQAQTWPLGFMYHDAHYVSQI